MREVTLNLWRRRAPVGYYPSRKMATAGLQKLGSHWKSMPVRISVDVALLDQPERDLLDGMTTPGSPGIVELLPCKTWRKFPRYTDDALQMTIHRWLRCEVDTWRKCGATHYRIPVPFFSDRLADWRPLDTFDDT